MATLSKTGTALKGMHRELKKLYTRLEKIKSKIPVKERDPRLETVSFHLRATGVHLATHLATKH